MNANTYLKMTRLGAGYWCSAFSRLQKSQGADAPIFAVNANGDTVEDAEQKMHDMLHTQLCDVAARELGDTLDARIFGATIEWAANNPAATITEDEVTAAVVPISAKARALRQAIRRHDKSGIVLNTIIRGTRLAPFRDTLDALCKIEDILRNKGVGMQTTRGPRRHGSADDWILLTVIHAWRYCIGSTISTATRSRFMRVTRAVLPEIGIDLGADDENGMRRRIERLNVSLVAKLEEPISPSIPWWGRDPHGVTNSKK